MSEVNDPSVDRELEALKQEYYRSLTPQLEKFLATWRTARADGPGSAGFKEFYGVVHRFSGKSDTFGMPEVGHVAREIERKLVDLQNTGGPLTPVDFAYIESRVSRLVSLAARFIPTEAA